MYWNSLNTARFHYISQRTLNFIQLKFPNVPFDTFIKVLE